MRGKYGKTEHTQVLSRRQKCLHEWNATTGNKKYQALMEQESVQLSLAPKSSGNSPKPLTQSVWLYFEAGLTLT